MNDKSPSLLWLILILVLLAVFGFVGGRYLLNTHQASTMEQLAIVWPQVDTLPEPERAFLVELAHTCQLTTRDKQRAEVIACLRSVPMDPSASARLERLLGQAPR